jgi:hypothetical protein
MSRMALPACVTAVVVACLAAPLWFGMRGGPARGRGGAEPDDAAERGRLRERRQELDRQDRALFGRLIAKGHVTAQLRAGRETLREAAEEFRVIDLRTGRVTEEVRDEAYYFREVIDWVRARYSESSFGPGLAELLEAEREALEAERSPPP